jgi:hypothetical protein
VKTRFVLIPLLALHASCDPVNDAAIAALGPEAPGVPRGPLHRPGQPCILCHSGNFRDPPGFSVAGTVFVNASDTTPAVDAGVLLRDSLDASYQATTNAAGNFYVLPSQFTPTYPMKVEVDYADVKVQMTANVGRDGSCAKCHVDPASSSSPGHVYIPPDGGTP